MSELLPLPDLPELDRETSRLELLLQAESSDQRRRTYPERLKQKFSTYFLHSEHAEFRLKGIYNKYQLAHACYADQIDELDEREHEPRELEALGNAIIWDFHAFLSSLVSAVNVLRDVALQLERKAFADKASTGEEKPLRLIAEAERKWIKQLEQYYQLAQTQPLFEAEDGIRVCRYSDGWELRVKLPATAEKSRPEEFRFSRRAEVLRFALKMFRSWRALDGALYRSLKGANSRA